MTHIITAYKRASRSGVMRAKSNMRAQSYTTKKMSLLTEGPTRCLFVFFFQAEDGIRDLIVTGVQTCALPILLENPDIRPILTAMIELSALPLKAVEDNFAVDSSGFGVSRFFRWYDHKYGVEKDRRDWRSEEHTSELQSRSDLVCRLLLEKKK